MFLHPKKLLSFERDRGLRARRVEMDYPVYSLSASLILVRIPEKKTKRYSHASFIIFKEEKNWQACILSQSFTNG